MYRFFHLTVAAIAITVVLCDKLENLDIERDAKLSTVFDFVFIFVFDLVF